MIAIRDILIFLAGVGIYHVYLLTQRYLYGKRIGVSRLTQTEEMPKPRKIQTELPPVDTDRFNNLLRQINTHDDFAETHSKHVKDRI